MVGEFEAVEADDVPGNVGGGGQSSSDVGAASALGGSTPPSITAAKSQVRELVLADGVALSDFHTQQEPW